MQPTNVAIGQIIDRKYRVERVLGAGGMGIVVAAQHLALAKPVALKFLSGDRHENADAVARLNREARALARITSAHVAQILDVGACENGEPYLVMEYLHGTDLANLLKREKRLSIETATDYIIQACEGVAEAHAIGIVHRDLKPSNLFLATVTGGAPLIKVLDFGIAKSITLPLSDASQPSATTTGALIGSPSYMSPEQIRDARRVDWRTDIWALGVVLYELLCGKLPFHGTTLAGTLAAVAADAATPIRSIRSDVPIELEAVILRCLEKNIDLRYQSLEQLAAALLAFAPSESRSAADRIHRILQAAPAPPVESVPRDVEGSTESQLATARNDLDSLPLSRGRNVSVLRWLLPLGLAGLTAGLGVAQGRWQTALRPSSTPETSVTQTSVTQTSVTQTLHQALPQPISSHSEIGAGKVDPIDVPAPTSGTPVLPTPSTELKLRKSRLPTEVRVAPAARAALTAAAPIRNPEPDIEEDGTHDRK
jgi:serine/threonine-protein kinase